jgi:molybdopterin synthase sulfur carrier subunit
MKIRLLFFASYRELLGKGEEFLDLPEETTVADLLQELWARGEGYSSIPAGVVVAVNRAFVPAEHALNDGDEVALVPPVAGG